jgi:hypothetical protein
MTWIEIVDHETRRTREQLQNARKMLGHASKVYEEKPSRANRINLAACRRLVKESEAMADEWKQ